MINYTPTNFDTVNGDVQLGHSFLVDVCNWLNHTYGSDFSVDILPSAQGKDLYILVGKTTGRPGSDVRRLANTKTVVFAGFLLGINLEEKLILLSYGYGWDQSVSMHAPDCYEQVRLILDDFAANLESHIEQKKIEQEAIRDF